MKLSDIMSAMDLAGYAEAGLVLFLVAFAAVAVDVIRGGQSLEALSRLPFDSDSHSETSTPENPS